MVHLAQFHNNYQYGCEGRWCYTENKIPIIVINSSIMIRYLRSAILLSVMLACTSLPSSAQGTADDYNRAYSLREKYSQSHVLYADVEPHWIEDTDSFWYVRNTERGREYALVDARGARRTDLFNHGRLAERLSAMSGKKVEPYRIYINN